ncbi:MAG: nitrogen regulation protein NR(II) [Burkholderiaceae bacterium]
MSRYSGFETLSISIIVLDGQGRIDYINGAAELLFEVSARLVRGEPVECLLVNPVALSALVEQARTSAYRSRREEMGLLRPGRREPVDVLITAVIPEDWPDGMILEIIETDTRMRAAREDRMLELAHEHREILRNLAHEVKNPLGGIRGAAQLLSHEMPATELIDCADVIVKETERLERLVDRLLEPHRQPTEPELVNVHEVCEHICKLLVAEFPNTLEIARDYDTSLPDLLVDRQQMIQILLNLTRNAAQALEGSGRINLVTRVARQVTIARRRHKLALELHVIDNGPGVNPKIRDRVFLPLVTGRADGTGLGLTLVQSFVQQNGGSIDLSSEPGRTDFHLLFPLSTAPVDI